MTADEAKKVADAIYTADGGCMSCALALADELRESFPEYDWEQMMYDRDDAETKALHA